MIIKYVMKHLIRMVCEVAVIKMKLWGYSEKKNDGGYES